MSYVHPRNTRFTRGRCHACVTSYVWTSFPRFRDALCPKCGASLSQWHPKQRGVIRELKPAARQEQASL